MRRTAAVCALGAVLAARTAAGAGGVLVVAPHPDDEVLSAGGFVRTALLRGREVNVVVVTNGDFFGTDQGVEREGESVAALGELGVTEPQVVFLGYPDGGTLSLWNDAPTTAQVYLSPHTGRQATYGNRGLGGTDFHTFRTGAAGPYNRPTLVDDVRAVLERFRPDDIVVTGEFDQHTDHRTTFYALREAVAQVAAADPAYRPTVHTTIIHDPLDYPYDDFWPLGVQRTVSNSRGNDDAWPNPSADSGVPNRFDPTMIFDPPPSLPKTILDWTSRSLFPVPPEMSDPHFDTNLKIRSLQRYGTQAGPILWAHAKADEFFWSEPVRVGAFRTDVARGAVVSASSAAPEQPATGAVDGIVDGAPNAPGAEWAAAGPGPAWIRVAWTSPVPIDRVVLHDRVDLGAHVLAGRLDLDDGTELRVPVLANDGRGDEIVLDRPHRVSALTFTADAADGTPGLAEIEVFGSPEAIPCRTMADCPSIGACTAPTDCNGGFCVFTPAADGTPCGDADRCNGIETCVAGECRRDPPPSCEDGDPCTRDVCVPPGQCVHQPECQAVPVRGKAGCRLAFVGLPSGTCEDGNPACDRDETTDRGCRFDLILCANMGQRAGHCDLRAPLRAVAARSRRVPEMDRLTSLLGARLPLAAASCVGPTSIRVRLGPGRRPVTRRRVPFIVTTGDRRRLHATVTLACRAAPPGVSHRPPTPLSP